MILTSHRYLSLGLAAAVCMNAVGCQAPRSILEYHPGSPTTTRTVMDPGVFSLWKSVADVHHHWSRDTRVTEVYIQSGEEIGFAREGPDLLCVAGAFRFGIKEARYRWRIVQIDGLPPAPTATQSFLENSAMLALVIILLPLELFLSADNSSDDDFDSSSTGSNQHRPRSTHQRPAAPTPPKKPASRP